jgi:ribonucleotide reductase beta subunit family protein with ferritin-like domain
MDFENFKSVQTWLKELKTRYNNDEINLRVELLKNFCDFAAKNPDELVNEVYNFDTHKPRVKKRDDINERIDEFINGLEVSASIKVAYGNMLEGFFLYNGVRMFRRRKVWTHPGRISPE